MQRYELRLLLPCHMLPRKEAADMLASLQCSATEQQGLAPQLVEQLPAQPAALAAAAGGQATCSTDKVTSADHPTARATTRRLKSTRQDLLLPLSCAEGGISQPPFPPIRLAVRHCAAGPSSAVRQTASRDQCPATAKQACSSGICVTARRSRAVMAKTLRIPPVCLVDCHRCAR